MKKSAKYLETLKPLKVIIKYLYLLYHLEKMGQLWVIYKVWYYVGVVLSVCSTCLCINIHLRTHAWCKHDLFLRDDRTASVTLWRRVVWSVQNIWSVLNCMQMLRCLITAFECWKLYWLIPRLEFLFCFFFNLLNNALKPKMPVLSVAAISTENGTSLLLFLCTRSSKA